MKTCVILAVFAYLVASGAAAAACFADYKAKQTHLVYRLEELRVAYVHEDYEPVNLEPGEHPDPLASVTARVEYFDALAKRFKVEMDLGLRFAKVWREMGLSTRLPREIAPSRQTVLLKKRPSLWLWRTRDVLASDESRDRFLRLARDLNARRVYAYLYSDSQLLSNRIDQERLAQFILLCYRDDIEVWALLGEPEWLDEKSTDSLSTAIQRIRKFNGGFTAPEPKISGIKLDLEPHALPEWDQDPERRDVLNARFQGARSSHGMLR